MPESEPDEGDTLRRRFSESSQHPAGPEVARSSFSRRLQHNHTLGRILTDGDVLR